MANKQLQPKQETKITFVKIDKKDGSCKKKRDGGTKRLNDGSMEGTKGEEWGETLTDGTDGNVCFCLVVLTDLFIDLARR